MNEEILRAIQIIEDCLLRVDELELKFELSYCDDEDDDGNYQIFPMVLYEVNQRGESSRFDQTIISSGYGHETFERALIGIAISIQAWRDRNEKKVNP